MSKHFGGFIDGGSGSLTVESVVCSYLKKELAVECIQPVVIVDACMRMFKTVGHNVESWREAIHATGFVNESQFKTLSTIVKKVHGSEGAKERFERIKFRASMVNDEIYTWETFKKVSTEWLDRADGPRESRKSAVKAMITRHPGDAKSEDELEDEDVDAIARATAPVQAPAATATVRSPPTSDAAGDAKSARYE
jgi:hypothetical protein